MTSFEDLDDDVLYLILDYLYLERSDILRSFRLTSRRLKDFADAVAHRTLSLIDDDLHEQLTYRLTERLTNPFDRLCHYVRDFRVANFKGDAHSYCLNDALISSSLCHVQRLDAFSWSCDTPMPTKLLHDLHHRFPKAQLCASVRLVDEILLPIPQLHRLDVSVPCADFLGDYSISMFGCLKQALLRSPTLSHLSIDTHHDVNAAALNGATLDRLQIPLDLGDKLPPLKSLDIRSTTYAYDADHCKKLLASIDHNRLQSLTIGANNPIDLFKTFRQQLPHLSHLDISYTRHMDDLRDLLLGACSSFVATLPALRSLYLRCDNLDLRSQFFRNLTETHGSKLLHLRLQHAYQYYLGPICCGNLRTFLWSYIRLQRKVRRLPQHAYQYYLGPICCGNLRTFLWSFIRLRSLHMSFPDIQCYHRCRECEGYRWEDPTYFSFIPPLPSLRAIDLSIRAPYSERPLLTSINAHAHCALRYLWTTFVNRTESELETVSLRFWRWATDGRKTGLKEVVYDSTRLRGKVVVKVRHRRDVPVVVYKEILSKDEEGKVVVNLAA